MSAAASAPLRAAPRRHLFAPAVDFLCLGGASLVVLATIAPAPPFVRGVFGRLRRPRLAVFVGAGALLGFAGSWGLPLLPQAAVPCDRTLFGAHLFLFACWIFINVHHYVIDHVLWRRDNPESRQWLFGANG